MRVVVVWDMLISWFVDVMVDLYGVLLFFFCEWKDGVDEMNSSIGFFVLGLGE